MELLSGSSKPSEDRNRFMRAQAYNFIIGGSDAHGKNYGLLLGAHGRFRLAPLYDVISFLPYIRRANEDKLAMSIDGYYRFDRIQPRHWEAESRKSGFSGDVALAHVRDLIARVPDEAASMMKSFAKEGIPSDEIGGLVDLIAERCVRLAKVYGREATTLRN